MRAIVLAACAALGACASHPAVTTQCLPLKDYTPAQQRALALEVAALPPGSLLFQAIADYGAMRLADRAACGTP